MNSSPSKVGKYRIACVSLLALATAETGATDAHAQQATQSPGTAEQTGTVDQTGRLEEIVVTARKRSENLQSTPIAISAFTAQSIERRGFNNLSDLSRATPSLVFNTSAPQSNNPSAASVFLRGIGQIDYTLFTDPGVGIYLDGVYIARSVGSVLDFTDLERVEILRGPQGTLFGRNTIGGAISVTSKKPRTTFGGDVTATIGSGNRIQLLGTINIPLADNLFSKFTGFIHKRDGYVYRRNTGQRLGNNNDIAGQAQFLWNAADNFTALLSFDATHKRQEAGPNVLIAASGTGYLLSTTDNGANITAVPRPFSGPLAGGPLSAFNASIGGICATADLNTSTNCFGAAQVGAPYTDNGTAPGYADLDVFGAALTLDWGATDWIHVKSITAYRTVEDHFARDTDHSPDFIVAGVPTPLNGLFVDDDQKQFSQEFQFTGNAFDNRLKWLMGAYYFHEDGFERLAGPNAAAASNVGDINQKTNNLAFFGEATIDVTRWLHLTGGIRYTHEKKDFQTTQRIVAPNSPALAPLVGNLLVGSAPQQLTTSAWTPRFTLSVDANKDTLLYATYSQGFKSGGFNGRYAATPLNTPVSLITYPTLPNNGAAIYQPAAPVPFQPEYVTMYEGGLKYSTPARNFRANIAIFRNSYTDIQVTFRPFGVLTPLTAVGNAARGRIQGVEAEFTLIPFEGLTIDAGGSYLDAKYTAIDARVPAPPSGIGLGTPFVNTPKWQTNASVSYAIDLDAKGIVTPRIDWSYRSLTTNDNLNSAF